MQATVLKSGHVALAKSVRAAAKIRVGDRLEVECTSPGKVILRRVSLARSRQRKGPLLNVKPFPRGALERIYQDREGDSEFPISSAIAAQRIVKFEE